MGVAKTLKILALTLCLAGRAPNIWAGVSAWVPVTDLKLWYQQCMKIGETGYADEVVKSCGGVPGQSPAVDLEYKKRSPVPFLNENLKFAIDINAGIRDDNIPIDHSLNAFNLLVPEKDRISKENISYFVKNIKVPPHFKKPSNDPLYSSKQPLFRKTSGNKRVTIFDGGHEIVARAALTWLAEQKKP
ncbi:hypothetical protein ACFL3G_08825 [Planctomycetota bacterium]